MIVVVDSGIWTSAIAFGGTPRLAVERVAERDTAASCAQVEREVLGVLCAKFGYESQHARSRFQSFLSEPLWIVITGEVSGVCRDPKDDYILECAWKAGAEIIVTGDNDLLSLGEF